MLSIDCPFCGNSIVSIHGFICDNHIVKPMFYFTTSNLISKINFRLEYSVWIDWVNKKNITLYYNHEYYAEFDYVDVTPENVESVINKMLSLKAFL